MSKQSQASKSLHPKVVRILEELGGNLRRARKRRKLTISQVADLALVSRNTVARAERGDPSVSLAVIASILSSLQLEQDLARIASPETDALGMTLEHGDTSVAGTNKGDEYDF